MEFATIRQRTPSIKPCQKQLVAGKRLLILQARIIPYEMRSTLRAVLAGFWEARGFGHKVRANRDSSILASPIDDINCSAIRGALAQLCKNSSLFVPIFKR
jgi:hypothetical protein